MELIVPQKSSVEVVGVIGSMIGIVNEIATGLGRDGWLP